MGTLSHLAHARGFLLISRPFKGDGRCSIRRALPSVPSSLASCASLGRCAESPEAEISLITRKSQISLSNFGGVDFTVLRHHGHCATFSKKKWRRGRDSNPRYGLTVHRVSRPTP